MANGTNQKLGPFLLSGLLIGPILGSGIILLPPLVYEVMGDYAFAGWLAIMMIGACFAYLFAKLSILYPGDAGVAIVVEKAYGQKMKHLVSLFLTLAACIGPIAVLSTAGEYIQAWLDLGEWHVGWFGLTLLGISSLILLNNISNVGKVSCLLSSLATVILFSGSVVTLLFYRQDIQVGASFEWSTFGYGLLILYWAIVGWELIGNYSLEVRDRTKTITRATLFSLIVITIVCLTVAAAVQWVSPQRLGVGSIQPQQLDIILTALFGPAATALITFITVGLCVAIYLLIIGGVSRLVSTQAKEGFYPSFLAFRTKAGVPLSSIALLTVIHTTVFLLLLFDWFYIEQLVAIANTFFICYTLLGILAAYRLLTNPIDRLIILFCTAFLLVMLLFTSRWLWLLLFAIVLLTFVSHVRHRKIKRYSA